MTKRHKSTIEDGTNIIKRESNTPSVTNDPSPPETGGRKSAPRDVVAGHVEFENSGEVDAGSNSRKRNVA